MPVRPLRALAGGAGRPDPAMGVFETLLVRDGEAVDLGAHLARLESSVSDLYGRALPEDLAARIADVAAEHPLQRLRVLAAATGAVEVEGRPLDHLGEPEPVTLVPACLPGGLGAHKWRDRRLLSELERRAAGGVPLLVDLDGQVLEAAWANVFVVEDKSLVTPPLDGRQLAGTVRARLLETAPQAGLDPREAPLTLERLTAADEVLLSSSIRGISPAALADAPRRRFEAGAQLREALLGERPLMEAR